MRKLSLPLALAALALLAPAASARDQTVTSFDGTQISTQLLPRRRAEAGPEGTDRADDPRLGRDAHD